MKIVVAHNYYKQAGGEDQCVAAEMALLQAKGHTVIPYVAHNDAIDGMSRIGAAARAVWNPSAQHEVRELLREHRPQVVHFHNTFPLISPAAYTAAREEDVPVVQTLHNFRLVCPSALLYRDGHVCEECLGKSIPWPGVVHKCYRDSRAASTAVAGMLTVHRSLGTWRHAVNVYIALTQFSRSKLVAGGLPANRIAVKPNFVFPDPGTGDGDGGYAIFVGRLSAEKGISVLLDAWKKLDGSVLLKIVGTGPLESAVEVAVGSCPAIQWLGKQPLEEVYRLIGDAKFLVLPSQCYENFPRVVTEAYAKGTPVIASRLGAMAEVVDHGRTGMHFAPGDADDLAARVREFVRLADNQAMRLAARAEYEALYTGECNYRTLMSIYERAMQGGLQ